MRLGLWLVLVVLMAGCSSLQDFKPRMGTVDGAELVIEMTQGDLVYELNTRRPEVVYPFMQKVDEGYYDGGYVDKLVPGLFAMTGDGQWNRKKGWQIEGQQEPGRPARAGELGMVQNKDGSYGPFFVMAMTRQSLALDADVPPTLVLGWLVEGRDVLPRLRKSDKILRVYGRGFDAAKEPAYVP